MNLQTFPRQEDLVLRVILTNSGFSHWDQGLLQSLGLILLLFEQSKLAATSLRQYQHHRVKQHMLFSEVSMINNSVVNCVMLLLFIGWLEETVKTTKLLFLLLTVAKPSTQMTLYIWGVQNLHLNLQLGPNSIFCHSFFVHRNVVE